MSYDKTAQDADTYPYVTIVVSPSAPYRFPMPLSPKFFLQYSHNEDTEK